MKRDPARIYKNSQKIQKLALMQVMADTVHKNLALIIGMAHDGEDRVLIKSMIGNLNQWLIDHSDNLLKEKEAKMFTPQTQQSSRVTRADSYFHSKHKSHLGYQLKDTISSGALSPIAKSQLGASRPFATPKNSHNIEQGDLANLRLMKDHTLDPRSQNNSPLGSEAGDKEVAKTQKKKQRVGRTFSQSPLLETARSGLRNDSDTLTVMSKLSHKVAANAKDIIRDLKVEFGQSRKGEVNRKNLLKGS